MGFNKLMSKTTHVMIVLFVGGILSGCTTTNPSKSVVQDELLNSNSFAPATAEEISMRYVKEPEILAIGDSMMSWNSMVGHSIPQRLAHELGETVTSRAVPGAKMDLRRRTLIGMSIPSQFKVKKWDTVVMNGGGNDLWQTCGCGKCGKVLDTLISADGKRGKIPSLVKYAVLPVTENAIYVSYLSTPGVLSLTDGCADEGDELAKRLEKLDRAEPRFSYLSVRNLVPHGSMKYHAIDGVHPSPFGSQEIAKEVAKEIREMRQ